MTTDNTPIKVPYGYEPPEETAKGTLLIYDSFDFPEEEETFKEAAAVRGGALDIQGLQLLTDWAERRSIARIVLYVPHEETLKRMGIPHPAPMHKREKSLEEIVAGLPVAVPLEIDTWERRRKKYTPMDLTLRTMTEKYRSPYFVGLSGAFANRFASYQHFEEWIRKLRLVVAERSPSFVPHPLLQNAANRWSRLGE